MKSAERIPVPPSSPRASAGAGARSAAGATGLAWRRLPAVLLAAVCAAGLALGAGSPERAAPPEIQRPLDHLRARRYAQAERDATALASRPENPEPRAWLIAAAARQGQGQYAEAARAYETYLAAGPADATRAYAQEQMRLCREVLAGREPGRTPSQRLSPADREELAKVGADFHTETSAHFEVRARNVPLAKLLAGEAEAFLERITGTIVPASASPRGVRLTVWADRAEFLAHAEDAPEWSGGSFRAAEENGRPVLRIDLTQRDADGRLDAEMLDRVLPHELCHLVLREFFGSASCPLFLEEGLATLAEARPDPQRAILAGTALAGVGKLPLEEMIVQQREDLEDPDLFYAEATSLAEFLHTRLSAAQFRRFLEQMKAGCDLADSLQRALCAAPRERFLTDLAAAWEREAIQQGQFLRALSVESPAR